jgi:hypothetical protein
MVRAAMDVGELRPRDPELTAHLVLAALIEAALLVAAAPEPGPVRAHCEQLIDELIDGLAAGRPAR